MSQFRHVGIIAAGIGLALLLPFIKGPSAETISIWSNILVEGRSLTDENEIRMSFPGSQLRLATPSEAVSLDFHLTKLPPGSGVDIQINGGEWTYHALTGSTRIELSEKNAADGLVVNVIRRSEAWQGDLIFVGAHAQDGFVKPSRLPKTKLLFIGDSITAGAGTESRINPEGQREAVSNARLAYPRVLGDRLNAQVHQIAYGGRGLVRDWQGLTDTNNAPQFYDRVLPDQARPVWDPKDYPADIVSIMLGTNDFNPGIPDRETWTQSYRDFVSRVQSDYPNAQVFLISSPMTDGKKGNALKDYVRSVAESFETQQVQYIEVSKYYGEPWDSHPTAVEHEKIADELEPYFRGVL